ncbi:hypothetical protein NM208_g4336 [Fusarium decemcellulare]|uniref:Uncharacterized protein n=2 Tax=Fusarium decemcellulare TaxID=57161 RepID=A0ACC1SL46_9HYPO|nr:hypothetical protein NM208_g9512 [Fusarium decemcellulare]KAJ3541973.1 hypothetical protein NM208_g4336 [Fusarium decemcellulare]
MHPVDVTGLKKLITAGTVLILDKTRLTISYVNHKVRRCPRNITSKQGNTSLPLELWLHILDWAEFDVNSHQYALVQARCIEAGETGPTIVCRHVHTWDPCRNIESGCDVPEYELYLEEPEGQHIDLALKNPLVLLNPNGNNPVTKVPLKALQPGHAILYSKVEVPDIIAWLENGWCGLCFCRRIDTGHPAGMEICEMWSTQAGSRWSDYPSSMDCPLCIGFDYCEQSLIQENSGQYLPVEMMPEEEYCEWRSRRFRELGYA